MAYSKFIQQLNAQWTDPIDASNTSYWIPHYFGYDDGHQELFDLAFEHIAVADETDDTTFVYRSGATIPTEKAHLFGIRGTNLRFFLYLAPPSSYGVMHVSCYKGLSLMSTTSVGWATPSSAFVMQGRFLSANTYLLNFAPYDNASNSGNGCIVIAKGVTPSGESKVFLLAGCHNTNTIDWYCETGSLGKMNLPACNVNASFGDYISMSKLVIPGIATFDEVYTTVYRGNSNGQIIHTAEGTFASMTGNNSYAQFYIKCPDE